MIDRPTFKKNVLAKGEGIIALTATIILVILYCTSGKIIEGSLAAELGKWVFMGILVVLLCCGLAWWPLSVYADFKYKKLEEKEKK